MNRSHYFQIMTEINLLSELAHAVFLSSVPYCGQTITSLLILVQPKQESSFLHSPLRQLARHHMPHFFGNTVASPSLAPGGNVDHFTLKYPRDTQHLPQRSRFALANEVWNNCNLWPMKFELDCLLQGLSQANLHWSMPNPYMCTYLSMISS